MMTGNLIVILASIAALVRSRRSEDTSKAQVENHSPAVDVFLASDFSPEQIHFVSDIVNSLERLDIIDAPASCLTLDSIQVSRNSDRTGAIQVGFKLHIKEWDTYSVESTSQRGDGGHNRSRTECFEILKTDTSPLAAANGTGNSTEVLPVVSPVGGVKSSHGKRNKQEVLRTRPSHFNREGKSLSSTQVVVIATCSAVIGVFFLIVLSMRIRSYMKRLREEEAIARRPTFRSCSVALRNTNERSDSDAKSATEEREAVHLSMGNGLRTLSAEAGHSQTDIRPLLLVSRSPSLPVSPTGSNHHIEAGRVGFATPYEKNQHIAAFRRYSANSELGRPCNPPKVIIEDADHFRGHNHFSGAPNPAFQSSPCEERCASTMQDVHTSQERLMEYQNVNDSPATVPLAQDTAPSSEVVSSSPTSTEAAACFENSTDAAMTQSDSSSSSENPSYRYGNQTEYLTSDCGRPCRSTGSHGDSQEDLQPAPCPSIRICSETTFKPAFNGPYPDSPESTLTGPHTEPNKFTGPRVEAVKPSSLPIVKLDLAPCPAETTMVADTDLLKDSGDSDTSSSDSESDDTVLLAATPPDTPGAKDTLKVYDENSFLLGPEFEGMEPTFV